ncbi:MAG: methyltransferase domain-containing protein [Candidatus Lokiarchaeota archaeon]|nr:methyltransferase domain-containing protein [Candidatus Lokiarchaeota archaeon]
MIHRHYISKLTSNISAPMHILLKNTIMIGYHDLGRREMKSNMLKKLRCPKCKNQIIIPPNTELIDAEIACKKGHVWNMEGEILSCVYPPISEEDKRWIDEYDELAPKYDDLVKQYDDFLGADISSGREDLLKFIPKKSSVSILDVCIGTAANFEALAPHIRKNEPRFDLYGIDLSTGMLQVSKSKMNQLKLPVALLHASVFNMPFRKSQFDLVIHTGGINTFSDISEALKEMLRVAKPEGTILVIDEGLSPKVRGTDRGKAIVEANALFAAKPPLEQIPEKAKDVEVDYIYNGTFYQLVFKK